MSLPLEFTFSQNKLQDFVDCQRLFELRHIQKLAWPAVRSEPVLAVERQIDLGQRFHQIVHQHQIGLSADLLAQQACDSELNQWWQNYLDYPPAGLPQSRLPEFSMSVPFARYRFVAKFDLLAMEPGERAVIIDWKTSVRRPSSDWLAKRLQTRLYPFILVEAGGYLNGGVPLQPDSVTMIYWFTNDPLQPETIHYSAAQYQQDREYILGLVQKVESCTENGFTSSGGEKTCNYCNYRSFCERGGQAGLWQEMEDASELFESEIQLDFDQMGEILF